MLRIYLVIPTAPCPANGLAIERPDGRACAAGGSVAVASYTASDWKEVKNFEERSSTALHRDKRLMKDLRCCSVARRKGDLLDAITYP